MKRLATISVAFACLAAAVPAAAMDEGKAKLAVTPKNVHRGGSYTLLGRGWNTNPNCSRTVRLKSSRGKSLGRVHVRDNGRFRVRRSISRMAARGFYAVTAAQACEGSDAVRTATLRIR